ERAAGEQEALVDALARAVAQQLADQGTPGEAAADPAFTARLERTVSAQMEGLRNGLEADIRALRDAMTRDLRDVAPGTGEPELLRAALDDMESDLLKKLRDSLRRRMQNMESGIDERFAHLQDSLGTLTELDGRLEQFQEIRERLQQLDAMEQRLEGLFAATREPAVSPAGSGEFPMSESRSTDDDASAFRQAITGLERHVGYGGIPPITDARSARPDDVDDARFTPAAAAVELPDAVSSGSGQRAPSATAVDDPFDHMLSEPGAADPDADAAPQPASAAQADAPAGANGAQEPEAAPGEQEATQREGPAQATGPESLAASEGYRGHPVTAERSPPTEQLDAQAPAPESSPPGDQLDALFDAVVQLSAPATPASSTAMASGTSSSPRAADRGPRDESTASEVAAPGLPGTARAAVATDAPGTSSIDQLFAGLEPSAAQPDAAPATVPVCTNAETTPDTADITARTIVAQTDTSGETGIAEAGETGTETSETGTGTADHETGTGETVTGTASVAVAEADPVYDDASLKGPLMDSGRSAAQWSDRPTEWGFSATMGRRPAENAAKPRTATEEREACNAGRLGDPKGQGPFDGKVYDEAPTECMDPIDATGDAADDAAAMEQPEAEGESAVAPELVANPESAAPFASDSGFGSDATQEPAPELGAAFESASLSQSEPDPTLSSDAAQTPAPELDADPESAPFPAQEQDATEAPAPELDADPESAPFPAQEQDAAEAPAPELDADPESAPLSESASIVASDTGSDITAALKPALSEQPAAGSESDSGDAIDADEQGMHGWFDAAGAAEDADDQVPGSAVVAVAPEDDAPVAAPAAAASEPGSMLDSLRACLPDLLADPATRQMLVAALAPELGSRPSPAVEADSEEVQTGLASSDASADEAEPLVGDASASGPGAAPAADASGLDPLMSDSAASEGDPLVSDSAASEPDPEPDTAVPVPDQTSLAAASDPDPALVADAAVPDVGGFEPDAATPPAAAAALIEPPAAEQDRAHEELEDLFGQLAAEAAGAEPPPVPQEEPESLGIGHGPAEPPDFTPQAGDEVLDVELPGMVAEPAAALPDDDAIPVAHTVGVAAAASVAPAAAQPAVAAATADPGMVADQLRAQLPELLRDEEVKQALFATLATEVVSRGSALGELTGMRRFVEAEIKRQLASLGSGAWG
ncbi:MAG: hypothetical protein ACOCYV_02480, partial [Planctomycetota bacterium]